MAEVTSQSHFDPERRLAGRSVNIHGKAGFQNQRQNKDRGTSEDSKLSLSTVTTKACFVLGTNCSLFKVFYGFFCRHSLYNSHRGGRPVDPFLLTWAIECDPGTSKKLLSTWDLGIRIRI